jgi:hypothetical protein
VEFAILLRSSTNRFENCNSPQNKSSAPAGNGIFIVSHSKSIFCNNRIKLVTELVEIKIDHLRSLKEHLLYLTDKIILGMDKMCLDNGAKVDNVNEAGLTPGQLIRPA